MNKLTIFTITLLILFILYYLFQGYSMCKDTYLKSNTPQIFDLKLDPVYQSPDYFKDKNVIICGLARDISDKIPYLEKNLETLTKNFKDHLILAVENDSKDDTRERLKQLKSKYNLIVLGCGVDSEDCTMNTKMYGHVVNRKRIKKMVDLRNEYMDYINSLENPYYYDFVIMLDYDMISSVYEDGLSNTAYYFEKDPSISMISANSVSVRNIHTMPFVNNFYIYYDLYSVEPSIKRKINYKSVQNGNVDDLVKIDSAFGGYAIYRLPSIIGIKYNYQEYEYGKPICEHVTFNRQISGNKYINPKMIYPVLSF